MSTSTIYDLFGLTQQEQHNEQIKAEFYAKRDKQIKAEKLKEKQHSRTRGFDLNKLFQ